MILDYTQYATDEDVSLRASADFVLLCPVDQQLAAGSDGAILTGEYWKLRSASVDFSECGIRPGHLVQFLGSMASLKPEGDYFAIESVDFDGLVLRRRGQPARVGLPPANDAGVSRLEFVISTLDPQIRRASHELNQRFGIDDRVPGRRSIDLLDIRDMREATVLTVLYRQYLDASRGSEGQGDTFAAKAQRIKGELDDALIRTSIRWKHDTRDGLGEGSSLGRRLRLSR